MIPAGWPAAIPVDVLALLALIVLAAGALNGIAGFGFALVGTMALASVIDPGTAVVAMIIPILAVNLSLATDLPAEDLGECLRRFAPLLAAALLGTVIGLLTLDTLPTGPLRVALGTLALAFVVQAQRLVTLPGRDRVEAACYVETRPAMLGVGAVAGLVFGGTNVGVQLVAYLRGLDLPHRTFVGVVAMIFLGLNGVRVAAAGLLGLYSGPAHVGGSLLAAVPALLGVAAGKRLRGAVDPRHRRWLVLAVLAGIGIRLVLAGVA